MISQFVQQPAVKCRTGNQEVRGSIPAWCLFLLFAFFFFFFFFFFKVVRDRKKMITKEKTKKPQICRFRIDYYFETKDIFVLFITCVAVFNGDS